MPSSATGANGRLEIKLLRTLEFPGCISPHTTRPRTHEPLARTQARAASCVTTVKTRPGYLNNPLTVTTQPYTRCARLNLARWCGVFVYLTFPYGLWCSVLFSLRLFLPFAAVRGGSYWMLSLDGTPQNASGQLDVWNVVERHRYVIVRHIPNRSYPCIIWCCICLPLIFFTRHG